MGQVVNKIVLPGNLGLHMADFVKEILARREAARASDPVLAARHAFWTKFDQQLAERKKFLKELRELAADDPEAQIKLENYEFQWGREDTEVADILHKLMLLEARK